MLVFQLIKGCILPIFISSLIWGLIILENKKNHIAVWHTKTYIIYNIYSCYPRLFFAYGGLYAALVCQLKYTKTS